MRSPATVFFEHYKKLEPGKWVTFEGWGGEQDAKQAILDAVDALRQL
jgi:inorganic pyrophosphatase